MILIRNLYDSESPGSRNPGTSVYPGNSDKDNDNNNDSNSDSVLH